MATTQMNVRIDEGLKLRGDVVFEKLGYSPTQVIRAVWGFAARNGGDLHAVAKLVDEAMRGSDPSAELDRRRRVEAAEAAGSIVEAAFEKMGVDAKSLPVLDDEWIERARYEHAVEKGRIYEESDREPPSEEEYAVWHEIAERMQDE